MALLCYIRRYYIKMARHRFKICCGFACGSVTDVRPPKPQRRRPAHAPPGKILKCSLKAAGELRASLKWYIRGAQASDVDVFLTSRRSVRPWKQLNSQSVLHDGLGTLVFCCERSWKFSWVLPDDASTTTLVEKCHFALPRKWYKTDAQGE